MIDHDDPLYKLLNEIGSDWEFTVVDLNPLSIPDIRTLHELGFISTRATDSVREWRVTLTDRGKAWLEAAENDMAIEAGWEKDND